MDIAIRLARESDAEQMLTIYTPIIQETFISFELEPPTLEEFRERIKDISQYAPWLVCEADGEIFGYAYAAYYRSRAAYQWSVEGSLYVRPEYQRRGIGSALSISLFECLRVLGFRNVYACIALPNPASVTNAEILGFKPVGVFHSTGYLKGEWRDVGWWELQLRKYDPTPAPTRRPQDVLGTPEWEQAVQKGMSELRT
jgi:phosphinothricin acetyltransferase